MNELFIYSPDAFLEILTKYCNKYLNLSNKTFMNIMKDFINKDNSIKNMYDTIRLFFVGNEENENIAGLLFGLTKEKKIGSSNISDLIYNNLNYSAQLKLKKSNHNLKEELEKIKNLTLEDHDLKQYSYKKDSNCKIFCFRKGRRNEIIK